MGKVKYFSAHSLKWCFLLYLPFCFIISLLGSFGIGTVTNNLQDWYENKYPETFLGAQDKSPQSYMVGYQNGKITYLKETDDGYAAVTNEDKKRHIIYLIISDAQMVIIPVWVMLCLAGTGIIFYNRELKKPFGILKTASDSIASNNLDFTISYPRRNELGNLCDSFEHMRESLYDNNLKMWHSLEERKRLNSAFSHDLRTPLTVLRGYTDYLCRYYPEGKVNDEKLMSTLTMMNGHISRLEHYVEGMNSVQKLEDLEPSYHDVSLSKLNDSIKETAEIIGCDKKAEFQLSEKKLMINADSDIIMQVYENLVSNAFRYAASGVRVKERVTDTTLTIRVIDDGPGFSENAQAHCTDPFFRDEKEQDRSHFGLGLYICRILCEKHGGYLTVSNCSEGGGCTEASFKINIRKN